MVNSSKNFLSKLMEGIFAFKLDINTCRDLWPEIISCKRNNAKLPLNLVVYVLLVCLIKTFVGH